MPAAPPAVPQRMRGGRTDIRNETDIVRARQAGRDLARELGFGTADQTRLATAISELARNIIHYAGEGWCVVTEVSAADTVGIRVVVEDEGPGIADLSKAMTMGYTTGKGLGAGLPGAKRLVHTFEIESQPGHTRIVLGISRRRA
ncbi:MAG: anti-sigma regulatory factor [Acidobacteriota bacterium]